MFSDETMIMYGALKQQQADERITKQNAAAWEQEARRLGRLINDQWIPFKQNVTAENEALRARIDELERDQRLIQASLRNSREIIQEHKEAEKADLAVREGYSAMAKHLLTELSKVDPGNDLLKKDYQTQIGNKRLAKGSVVNRIFAIFEHGIANKCKELGVTIAAAAGRI